jgi:xanthine dehydrogenase accessory factor
MLSIEEEIVKSLSQNAPTTLATVVYQSGSTPRGVGAKMLLKTDGTFVGTIGGGSVEAEVLREAQQVMETGEARTLHFELTNKNVALEGSVCGGDVTIFVDPLPAGVPDLLEMYEHVVAIKKRGGVALLATIVSVDKSHADKSKSKVLIDQKGKAIGSLLGDPGLIDTLKPHVDRLLEENRTEILKLQGKEGQVEILVEPIVSDPTVFIFGCGHISTCLAPLVKGVGFKLVVTDDRPDFANRKRFPHADEIVVDGFEGLLKRLKIEENSYLVLVTRGHLHDRTVLEQALKTNAKYIGMIGSRRKVKMVYQDLRDRGVSEDILTQVHAPIGLDIGAETPEEIAASILAELIQVRAGKQ